jgi:antitoxin component HigA of HigAB toxin-antitoxin module
MAITSKDINLAQLDQELGSKGLNGDFNDTTKKLILPADGSDVTEQELEAAIAAHIASPDPEPTVADKLASVGLSVDDLKAVLGLA